MTESPLFWPAHFKGNTLYVLDETLIPSKVKYIPVRTAKEAVKVIRDMKTRAFGQFLVVLNAFLLEIQNAKDNTLVKVIKNTAEALNSSRPTFPFSEVTSIVVGWAQKAAAEKIDVRSYVRKHIEGYLQGIRYRRLERVAKIAQVIQSDDSILTHCNVSGELAMAAAICQNEKKKIRFFATETRPYFQGSKLTYWELQKMGARVTLVADNAVGSLMSEGMVNKVIIGSDRSCANGDVANKIGSYQIAILAKEFDIPLYVLTQPSPKIKTGQEIPIEIRDPNELLVFEGKKIVPGKVSAFYPGFDVVPQALITQEIAINASA